MKKYEFDTAGLFEAFFGYRATSFAEISSGTSLKFPPQKQTGKYVFTNNELSDEMKETLLSVKGVKYYTRNSLGNLMYMPVTLTRVGSPGIVLENTVITMTCKKTLVETAMVGRQGTVKEEISINDWDISIKGIIVGRDRYPEDEVETLKELYEANEALTINNVLTAILLGGKQERVVMKTLDLGDNKGVEIAQPYTMQLVSDTQFELYVD